MLEGNKSLLEFKIRVSFIAGLNCAVEETLAIVSILQSLTIFTHILK